MKSNERRRANLLRSAQVYRAQAEQVDNMLSGMSDEDVNNFIDANPDVADMLAIGADDTQAGIVVNYKDQPNNQHEQISLDPPWETGNKPPWEFNFAAAAANPQQPRRVNLFSVGSQPAMMNNGTTLYSGYMYGMKPDDERLKAYTNGMKLYNIQPYAFLNASMMVDYYEACEREREWQENQNYGWALIWARGIGTEEALEWAESFKFKTADEIYEERMKAQQEEMKARQEAMSTPDDGNNVVYDVYDCNGVRLAKAFSVKVIDRATGEVVQESKHEKDALGQSFIRRTQMQDRQDAYKAQQEASNIAYTIRYNNTFRKLFTDAYVNNKLRWQRWKDEGLSLAEQYARAEDERIDWRKHEQAIMRTLRMSSFSRQNFNQILSSVCNMELDYANKSDFFSLSYDFERDLHYKSLISTPQEMNNDPLVHQKLQQEYDIKRQRFLEKIRSGNLGSNGAGANDNFRHTFAKPKIEDLTLEDFQKPENQFMYTQVVTPEIATENLFIPKPTEQPIIVPEQRVIGTMSVDDDTGQVLSQHEEVYSGPITDENISNYF